MCKDYYLYCTFIGKYDLYFSQQLTIEGTLGYQAVVLDDISIKPKGCGEYSTQGYFRPV